MGAFRGNCRHPLAALILVAAAAPAAAQEATERTPEAAQARTEEVKAQLPEMLVTTQKIRQTLEQVPASVSALTGEQIRDSGAAGFQEMQDYTANVSIRLSSGAGQYSIRGFGTPDTNPAFDPSVGTVVDGVYYARSNYLAAFFHDVQRFEVLRGPQGTLFGKNNTAGIFNVVTEAPEPEFVTRWELLAGSDGDRSFRPVVNLPLGGGFAARFSGNYAHGDRGTLHNTYLNRPERNVDQDTSRLRLRFAGDAITVDLVGLYSHQTQHFNQFQSSLLTPPMLELFQSYDPHEDAVVDLRNSASFESLEEGYVRSLAATLDVDLGHTWGADELRLTSISAVASITNPRFDLDADFSAVPFITDTMVVPRRSEQFSQEFHLSGHVPSLLGWGHGVSFVFGAYYFQSKFKTSDFFNIEDNGAAFAYVFAAQTGAGGAPGPFGTIGGLLGGPLGDILDLLDPVTNPVGLGPQNATVKLDQAARNYAVFGQAEHQVFEDWFLIGGLRFDIESKRGDASSHANGILIPRIAVQEDHDTHIERIEHQLSPKGGFKWSPSKYVEAYGTWTRGFKSGGFNALPLTPDNIEYEPEQATSIELGGKVRVLDGALRFSGAVFTTDFENLQVSNFVNNSFVVQNAGAARSRGFEIDLHWLTPLDGLALYTSFGLADARYTNYPCAPAPSDAEPSEEQTAKCNPDPPPVENPILPPAPTQDLAGKPLSFAPKWTAALIPSYSLTLPRYMVAVFGVDVLYRSKQYLNPDNDDRKAQPSTTLFNARIGIGDLTKNWKLTLVGHNLTDKIILDQAVDQPLAPGNIAVVRGDHGRFYTANLAITF